MKPMAMKVSKVGDKPPVKAALISALRRQGAYEQVPVEQGEQGADDPRDKLNDFGTFARYSSVLVGIVVVTLCMMILLTAERSPNPAPAPVIINESPLGSTQVDSKAMEARLAKIEQALASCTCSHQESDSAKQDFLAGVAQRLAWLETRATLQPVQEPMEATKATMDVPSRVAGGEERNDLAARIASLEQQVATPHLKQEKRAPINNNAIVHQPSLTKDMRLAASSFLFMTPETFTLKENVVKEGDRSWSSLAQLQVLVGDTVTWEWDSLQNVVETDEDFNIVTGSIPHWRSGDVDTKGSYSITFQDSGTYYFISENTSKLRIAIIVKRPIGIDRAGFFGFSHAVSIHGVCQTCQPYSGGASSPSYSCQATSTNPNTGQAYSGFDASPAHYNGPNAASMQFVVLDIQSQKFKLDITRTSCCPEDLEFVIDQYAQNSYTIYKTRICFGSGGLP